MEILKIVAAGGDRRLRSTIMVFALLPFLASCSTVKVETQLYPGVGPYLPLPYGNVAILRYPP